MQGEARQGLPNATFRVQLEKRLSGLGQFSGRMRVRFFSGSKVAVELTPYYRSQARIVFRSKQNNIIK